MQDEVRIDGVTGTFIETVNPTVGYDDVWGDIVIPYSRANYTVGDRTLVVVPSGEPNRYYLYENGENILPENFTIYYAPDRYGDRLWFEHSDWDVEEQRFYIVSPNEEDQLITLPNRYYDTGTNDYLFYTVENLDEEYNSDWQVFCLDWRTGESWPLVYDYDGADFYSVVTDGEWFYSCAPWSDEQVCWKLRYEDGKPVALELVNENAAPKNH